MSVLRVTCITRSESGQDGGIRAVGGKGFYHSVDQVVTAIDSRTHQYWAEVNGESVWLEVAYDADGVAYLTTENDQTGASELLGLEECETASEQESPAGEIASAIEAGPQSRAAEAERLAIRTILRMLVLNRYGHDEARLRRNRQDAIQRASAAIQSMALEDDSKKQLEEAVTRELHVLMAPAPDR